MYFVVCVLHFSSIPVGRVGFPASHLVENICGAAKAVASRVPRGWNNIQSVHIKSIDSLALPLFASLPPEPKSLPALEDCPPVRRFKLDEAVSLLSCICSATN